MALGWRKYSKNQLDFFSFCLTHLASVPILRKSLKTAILSDLFPVHCWLGRVYAQACVADDLCTDCVDKLAPKLSRSVLQGAARLLPSVRPRNEQARCRYGNSAKCWRMKLDLSQYVK
jgi:hypothetical protein